MNRSDRQLNRSASSRDLKTKQQTAGRSKSTCSRLTIHDCIYTHWLERAVSTSHFGSTSGLTKCEQSSLWKFYLWKCTFNLLQYIKCDTLNFSTPQMKTARCCPDKSFTLRPAQCDAESCGCWVTSQSSWGCVCVCVYMHSISQKQTNSQCVTLANTHSHGTHPAGLSWGDVKPPKISEEKMKKTRGSSEGAWESFWG